GTCGICGLAIGLGCSIFLLLLVIIVFIIWSGARRLPENRRTRQCTSLSVKAKWSVLSYAYYDKPATYISRIVNLKRPWIKTTKRGKCS
ncbi:hypothetical protein BgiBS90_026090, partial [Biomphalaria glabrata]